MRPGRRSSCPEPASCARRRLAPGRLRTIGRMDLDVVFLGTSGCAPTARRGAAGAARPPRRRAAALRLRRGHAAPAAALDASASSTSREIFLTHFHADHYLGLPGMLKTFALRGRDVPLTIYGPPGLARPVRRAAPHLRQADLPARARRAARRRRRSSATTTGSLVFPVTHGVPARRLRARRGRRGPAASTSRPPTRSACPNGPGARRAAARRGGHARGRALDHARRRCSAPARPGRKIVLTGDTAPSRGRRRGRARRRPARPRGDVLRRRGGARRARRGHSTAPARRGVARDGGRRLLALTHISPRYFGREVAREAREVFPETVVPRDFDIIDVRFDERGEPSS